ncbi:hypothetical protein [Chondromyces apiculatus]|uniref:Uncharacterized protein n=1 Tax=Chondromyces apiculatus DSM 436 TaxID=1192034 RepID=A0A017T2J9_9BACT|nr:hypothetical protein [Chondromyces apiculatus]EYF03463.1 Hypothetical protein CAP_5447 [Chondromyces apiculatus DSM 436]
MALKTLKARSAMLSLLPHPTFTLCQLRNHPLGAPHVAQFAAIKEQGRAVLAAELQHMEDMTETRAQVVAIDERLDAFAARLSKLLHSIGGESWKSALQGHYFEKPLHALTRPVLGKQLVQMRKWQLSLATSAYPALVALAPELDVLLTEAHAAATAWQGAKQLNREFRDVGARRRWIDRLNGARKEVHGALARLPHEMPHLPADFADRFFLTEEESGADDDEDDSVEDLQAELAAAQEAVVEVERRLAEAVTAEAAAQAEAEARAAKEAELVEMERMAQELARKQEALRKQLKGPLGPGARRPR